MGGGYFFVVPYSPAPKFITYWWQNQLKPKSDSFHTLTTTLYVENPAKPLVLLSEQLPVGSSSASWITHLVLMILSTK